MILYMEGMDDYMNDKMEDIQAIRNIEDRYDWKILVHTSAGRFEYAS